MPGSPANPNRKRSPGRGDWLLFDLKSSSPCRVPQPGLCRGHVPRGNIPAPQLLPGPCRSLDALLQGKAAAGRCQQMSIAAQGTPGSRIARGTPSSSCPSQPGGPRAPPHPPLPGCSLRRERGIYVPLQALPLSQPALQMKQHLINRRVGSLQSCQDKPTPFPPGHAQSSAAAQSPGGSGLGHRRLSIGSHQAWDRRGAQENTPIQFLAGFAWPWLTAGAGCPFLCSHPSCTAPGCCPVGARQLAARRHSGTLLLPPAWLCSPWDSSTAQALAEHGCFSQRLIFLFFLLN